MVAARAPALHAEVAAAALHVDVAAVAAALPMHVLHAQAVPLAVDAKSHPTYSNRSIS